MKTGWRGEEWVVVRYEVREWHLEAREKHLAPFGVEECNGGLERGGVYVSWYSAERMKRCEDEMSEPKAMREG